MTIPQGVVGDRLPWGGERQGGGGYDFPNPAKKERHSLEAIAPEAERQDFKPLPAPCVGPSPQSLRLFVQRSRDERIQELELENQKLRLELTRLNDKTHTDHAVCAALQRSCASLRSAVDLCGT